MELSAFDPEERQALAAAGLRPGMFGTGCPDPSVLLAAEDGVLDGETADAVHAHVATCQACAMLTSDLAGVFAEGDVSHARTRIAARLALVPPQPKAKRLMWGLAAGGLLAAASLAGVMVNLQPVTIPSIVRAGAVSVAPPNPPTVFQPDDASVPGAADVDLALRGESSTRLPDVAGADTALRPAADEAEWRKAVALVQAGDAAAARRILETLCSHPTWRGALACAGLIELDRQGKR